MDEGGEFVDENVSFLLKNGEFGQKMAAAGGARAGPDKTWFIGMSPLYVS